MHLGLIDRPFLPHNLISAQESPVPLPKFQMAPRLKILMSSGSQKGTQIYYIFLKNLLNSEPFLLVGSAQSVWRLTTNRTFRGSNPVGGRNFPHPSGPAVGPTQPPTQSFPGGKAAWCGVDHNPHLTPRLKKVYNYTSAPPLGLRVLL
jgi:hypothetical protein